MLPENVIKTSVRDVDLGQFSPIYNHPLVQNLGGKTQLSFVDKLYLGARHSRLEHAAVVFHFMQELLNHLTRKDMVNSQQQVDLLVAAITHDLGHPHFHMLWNSFSVHSLMKGTLLQTILCQQDTFRDRIRLVMLYIRLGEMLMLFAL